MVEVPAGVTAVRDCADVLGSADGPINANPQQSAIKYELEDLLNRFSIDIVGSEPIYFCTFAGTLATPLKGPRLHRGDGFSSQNRLPGARRMENESRDLLTVEQAADYLQVSQSSIRSYIRQGRLKAYRIAGKRKVLIPRVEILGLLEPARDNGKEPNLDGNG